MIFLTIGNAYMGQRSVDAEGNIKEESAVRFEEDPKGGCVAIGRLNSETMEQDGPASIYGDYDAAHYLEKVIELLKPSRRLNIPDIKSILQTALRDGCEEYICEYCQSLNCRDCIITEWKEETQEDG